MLIIKNAKISTGHENDTRLVDIYVDGGKIVSVIPVPAFAGINSGGIPRAQEIPGQARDDKKNKIIDAHGHLVIPGCIDPHVHFDTPGYTKREDFEHASKASAAGGVTTIIDMPDTSIPPITNVAALKKKLRVIKKQAHVDFALWAGVSQNSMRHDTPSPLRGEGRGEGSDWFSDMQELDEAGVVGFKTYLLSGMDTFRDISIIELGQVMTHARRIGTLVAVHAEDKKLIEERMSKSPSPLRGEGRGEGFASLIDYYNSRSDPAEKNAVGWAVGLAKQTHARLHIVHVGSGAAVNIIHRAKSQGINVTAETCPHYLAFTYEDFEKYGSLIKTAPVVKTAEDRDILWAALSDGTLDFVATDHAPCSLKDKKTGSCWTDYNGIPGAQFMLSYLFSEGHMKRRLTLARLIEITSAAAAKRYGLYPQKGAIEVGADADLVIINLDVITKIEKKAFYSKAKWSPFEGRTFAGKIEKTILRGRVIFDAKKGVTGKTTGEWVKPFKRNDNTCHISVK